MKNIYYFIFSLIFLVENSSEAAIKGYASKENCPDRKLSCQDPSYPYCVSTTGEITKGSCKGAGTTYEDGQCCIQDISCLDGRSQTDVYVNAGPAGQEEQLYYNSVLPAGSANTCPSLKTYLSQQIKR